MFKQMMRKRNQATVQRSQSLEGVVEPLASWKAYDFIQRDPNYLLRLAQNSKWAAIERCCKMFCRIFTQPIASDLLLVASKAQQQLLKLDQWGNTPLHVICYYRPPLKAVDAFLEAIRQAPGTPMHVLSTENHKGETPLLIAGKSGSCARVIRALCDACRDTVTMHGDGGTSIFEALVNRYTLIQRIPAIRFRYTGLKDMMKKEDLVASSEHHQMLQQKDCMEKFSDLMVLSDCVAGKPAFPYYWNIIETMMREAWSLSHQNSVVGVEYPSPLHGAAHVADLLPIDLSDMILRTHSEDIQSAIKPLHLAFARQISDHPKIRRQHAHVVRRLLEMDPSSAKTVIPETGRSIFCQAIASGSHWNLKEANDEEEEKKEGPVYAIFRQHPSALLQRDGETGLYPFMLAATAPSGVQEDCLQLDTIFNLLRSAPESICPNGV